MDLIGYIEYPADKSPVYSPDIAAIKKYIGLPVYPIEVQIKFILFKGRRYLEGGPVPEIRIKIGFRYHQLVIAEIGIRDGPGILVTCQNCSRHCSRHPYAVIIMVSG